MVFDDLGFDGVVVIGGNGSLIVVCKLHSEFGVLLVGVFKTIDNDIEGM